MRSFPASGVTGLHTIGVVRGPAGGARCRERGRFNRYFSPVRVRCAGRSGQETARVASGAGPAGEMAVARCGRGPGGGSLARRPATGVAAARCAGARSAQRGPHVLGDGAYLVPAGHQVKAGEAQLGEAGWQEPQLNHTIWMTTAHLAMRKPVRMAASGCEGGTVLPAQTPEAAGKVVAITGAGRGIGAATAWLLAARGALGSRANGDWPQPQAPSWPAAAWPLTGESTSPVRRTCARWWTSPRSGSDISTWCGAQQPVAGADLVAGGQLAACLGLGALCGRRPLLIPAVVIAGADACRGGDHLVEVRAAVGGSRRRSW
jgi:hypothetical protein